MSRRSGRIATLALMLLFTAVSSACSPEVGSEAWCEKMKEKDKGQWSADDAADFAKHCIFR